jgi:hypothetical protein
VILTDVFRVAELQLQRLNVHGIMAGDVTAVVVFSKLVDVRLHAQLNGAARAVAAYADALVMGDSAEVAAFVLVEDEGFEGISVTKPKKQCRHAVLGAGSESSCSHGLCWQIM